MGATFLGPQIYSSVGGGLLFDISFLHEYIIL